MVTNANDIQLDYIKHIDLSADVDSLSRACRSLNERETSLESIFIRLFFELILVSIFSHNIIISADVLTFVRMILVL